MSYPPTRARYSVQTLRQLRISNRQILTLVAIIVLCSVPLVLRAFPNANRAFRQAFAQQETPKLARLGDSVSGRNSDRGNPAINSSNARAVLTSYAGRENLRLSLEQNQAAPLSLATADFDEDGVPDLVMGYSHDNRGIVSLLRGNVDSIYPNSPEAKQREATNNFTHAPFISPAQLFDAGVAADFVGAGDFDADGHWDVVVAARGKSSLSFLRGDGRGNLAEASVINLPGVVTALITGEINRADGLTDVVVGVDEKAGAQVLVFEGPLGALKATPESFPISAPANSLALGQLSSAYTIDLAVACGSELMLVYGRDRELSLALKRQQSVKKAVIDRRLFPQALKSLAIGEFDGNPQSDIAVLLEDGAVHVLSKVIVKAQERSGKRQLLAEWENRELPSQSPGAERLFVANVSTTPKDDLLLLDSSDRQLHLLQTGSENRSKVDALLGLQNSKSGELSLALDSSEAVAVLPMQLDTDALTDLVILQKSQVEPNVVLTFTESFKSSTSLTETVKTKSTTTLAKDASRNSGLAVGVPQKSQTKFVAKGASTQSLQQAKAKTKRSGSIHFPEGSCPPPSSITIGQTINGSLVTTDCPLDDGSYVDFYTFTGTNGQQVSITLDSLDFDTYLYLLAPDGSLLADDDDGGEGTNSQIPSAGGFLTLPANGTYTILATSFSAEEVGDYTLSLNPPGGGGTCPATPLVPGQGVEGTLSTSDCVLITSGRNDGAFVDVYTFSGFEGQQAAVAMVSETFDTYLYLIGPDGSQVDVNDDIFPGNSDSRIPPTGALTLPANGVYTIFATSHDPGETGNYGVAIGLGPRPLGSTVVTNTNDGGPGSLRQAILNANSNQGVDTISFQVPAPRTIRPLSPLPEITDPVVIDGTTQPGFSGTPLIELNGELLTQRGIPGLKITAGDSRVRGLVINSFGVADCNVGLDVDISVGSGIILASGDNNIIEGNFIGTNLGGTAALCNSGNGIQVFNSSNNTIGGTTAAARNILSGNRFNGFAIGGVFSTGNRVQGNYVGTNVTGTGDLGNRGNGMTVISGTNNTIGGTVAGARNVVSGNDLPGIAIGFSDPAGILVQGNYIGTNAAGNFAIPNLGGGIIVGGFFRLNGDPITATDNTIGGTTVAARNVISGNRRDPDDTNPNSDAGNGVEIINEGSQRNKVQGNYIGLNAAGNAVIPNAGSGVFITRAPNNFIGGALTEIEGTTNYIAGNGRYGVGVGIRRLNDENPGQFITGGDSVDIVFNVIGTDPTQTLRLGNGLDGVYVDADSVDIFVNSNVIAFNGRSGVRIPDANGSPNDNDNSGIRVNLDLNFIFGNSARAVDLGIEGLTANDPLDADFGANLQQNFPNLNSSSTTSQVREGGVASTEALVNVNGTMNSSPNASYTMHWYFSSDSACSSNQVTSRPLVTGRIPNVTTDGAGNASFTIPLDLPPGVNSGVINCTATDSVGNTSEYSACLPVTSASQQVQVTIQTNPAGRSFTVDGTNYNATQTFNWVPSSAHTISTTSPQSGGTGTQFVWSSWSDNGAISHNVSPSSNTTFTANFTTQHLFNPLEDRDYFVRQNYRDFLDRDADAGGLTYWTGELAVCGSDATCIRKRRIGVSAAFFVELEFQRTGSVVYRMHRAAFGTLPNTTTRANLTFAQFIADRALLPEGSDIAQTTISFANAFVQRSGFLTAYPASQTNAQFVNKLFDTAALTPYTTERQQQIDAMTNNGKTRAQVLLDVIEIAEFKTREYNRSFVLMQYFGYLRRDPDQGGYDFWLGIVNNPSVSNYRSMVCAFLTSAEYQVRFSTLVPRSDAECGDIN